MTKSSYEIAEKKARLALELRTAVEDQINSKMDCVRARAYWESRLPELDLSLLAEALSYALDRAAERRR